VAKQCMALCKTMQLSAHAQNDASPERCRKSFTMIFLGDHDIPLSGSNFGNLTAFRAIFMVALCNRADHYIFILFLSSSFFLLFFSSPNLSGRRLDVYHTSAHGVVLV